MSTAPAPPPAEDAAVRHYTFLCLAALLVTLLTLLLALPRAGTLWILLPVLVGLGGLLMRWSIAPLLYLIALGGVLYVAAVLRAPLRPGALPPESWPGTDLLLVMAALAYVAGHYRLQGLLRAVFPRDPRRPVVLARRPAGSTPLRRPPVRVPERRSPALAAPGELTWLLVALPSWALGALIAYRLLLPRDTVGIFGDVLTEGAYEWYEYQGLQSLQVMVEVVWRGRALLWVLGFGVLVVSGVVGHLAWKGATRAEAEVFLQDTVWRETRREQRLLQSWRVWARWRHGRGKGNP